MQNLYSVEKNGAALQQFTIGQINNIQLPIPSLSEQTTIVMRLNTLSAETKRLEEIYRQKLADLEELKKSILSKAFAGEL